MKWLLIGLAGYIAYAAAMIYAHPQFIYPFGADRFVADGWENHVTEDRGVTLAVANGGSDVAILYFMGNAGAFTYFAGFVDGYVEADRKVVAMQFRGGGGIAGTPSEAGLKADALDAYDWLRETHAGPIVVHGYSMGTGLALYVAANRDVDAIVLDAPLYRMCDLMARASYLPACHLPFVQKWDSARLVGDPSAPISAPVLIQHGTADTLIPLADGARLVDLMRDNGLDVTFHEIEGATHTNIASQPGFNERIDAFLGQVVQR